ncbi:MAG: hypothetical protein ACRDJV_04560 [Actinomycetota bacterium]
MSGAKVLLQVVEAVVVENASIGSRRVVEGGPFSVMNSGIGG